MPGLCPLALLCVAFALGAGVLSMYELRLKEHFPGSATLTYDFNTLSAYLDDMVRKP